MQQTKPSTKALIGSLGILVVLLAGLIVFVEFRYRSLKNQATTLTQNISQLRTQLSETDKAVQTLQNLNGDLTDQIHITEKQTGSLLDEFNRISGTVGTLEKLSKIDSRLLQKYSKVYFLNENFVPDRLSTIDERYILEKNRTYQFHADAYSYLVRLLDAAKTEGFEMQIASAYRSFKEQTALKSQYTVVYGSGANKFSADQGYSEHQLGTTVDLTTIKVGGTLSRFETDPAYAWLEANAYKYGFILSYPKGNSYYIFEPWHWRFVGVDLAGKLHRDNLHFYDMDQHEIDKYLITLFD